MKLMNIDFLEFSKKRPNGIYELIIADPPYNNCVDEEWDNQWNNDEKYLLWIENGIKEFTRLLSVNGSLILYCKRQLQHNIKNILDKYLLERRSIIWARRRNMDVTRGKTLASGYEPILWYSKSDKYCFNSDMAKIKPQKHLQHRSEYQKGGRLEKGVGLTDVWSDIPALPHNAKEKTFHRTQKPLRLSIRLISIFSGNGTIYIPFAGSGSEILACIRLNKEWHATELNKNYYNLIRRRISKTRCSLKEMFY